MTTPGHGLLSTDRIAPLLGELHRHWPGLEWSADVAWPPRLNVVEATADIDDVWSVYVSSHIDRGRELFVVCVVGDHTYLIRNGGHPTVGEAIAAAKEEILSIRARYLPLFAAAQSIPDSPLGVAP